MGDGKYSVAVNGSYRRDILFVEGQPPKCRCSTCTAKRLPCKYLVAVCHKLNINPKQACYLNPRWLLKNHPMFSNALSQMSLVPAEHGLALEDTQSTAEKSAVGAVVAAPATISFGTTFAVPREHYDKISFPKDAFRRHNDLDTLAREVVTLGKGSEHGFKLAMATMAATKARLQTSSHKAGKPANDPKPGPPEVTQAILPPATKAQRKAANNDHALMPWM